MIWSSYDIHWHASVKLQSFCWSVMCFSICLPAVRVNDALPLLEINWNWGDAFLHPPQTEKHWLIGKNVGYQWQHLCKAQNTYQHCSFEKKWTLEAVKQQAFNPYTVTITGADYRLFSHQNTFFFLPLCIICEGIQFEVCMT